MAQGDIVVIEQGEMGGLNYIIGEIELSSTYPAGGIAVSPALFGLSVVHTVQFETVELAATTALVPRYDRATDKVMLHEGDAGTAGPLAQTDESVASATDLRFIAYGKLVGAVAS